MLRNIEDIIKLQKIKTVPSISPQFAKLLNLFKFFPIPALAELLGLQDESSYGQLLRTMPRDLKEEWTSMSS